MRLFLRLASCIGLLYSNQLMAYEWKAYFPTNTIIKAKVMALSTSKELTLISQKIQQGIANHQQWFKQYVNKLKAGEIMPYHPNLGISKAEYQQLISAKELSLKEVDAITLEFKPEKNGNIIIKTKSGSPLNGIIVQEDSVTTPYGQTNQCTPIYNSDKKSLTGPWTGIQWRLSDFDEQRMKNKNPNEIKGKELKFAVGTLQTSGEGILYYDVKDIDMPKNKKLIFSYIVYYPLSNSAVTD